MTEQQIETAKKLMEEYGLSAESPENRHGPGGL